MFGNTYHSLCFLNLSDKICEDRLLIITSVAVWNLTELIYVNFTKNGMKFSIHRTCQLPANWL